MATRKCDGVCSCALSSHNEYKRKDASSPHSFLTMQPYTDILGQINSMIVAMGSNVPLNTFKKITELIMKNPAIFSQACDLIERSIMNVPLCVFLVF